MQAARIDDLNYDKANNYYRAIVFDDAYLGQNNARFQIVKVPAGQTVESHYHRERTEVFVLLQGEGKIYINNELAIQKVHDVALCKPNDIHKVVNHGDTDMLVAVFALNYKSEDSIDAEKS